MPHTLLGRDISVTGSCEMVKCPDTALGIQCTKMRNGKAAWCLDPRAVGPLGVWNELRNGVLGHGKLLLQEFATGRTI